MEWQLLTDHFKKHTTSSLQLDAYNSLVHTLIPAIFSKTTFKATLQNDQIFLVHFGNVYIEKPQTFNSRQLPTMLFPDEARARDLNYEAIVYVDIFTQLVHARTHDIIETQTHVFTPLVRIPVMLRSSLCNLANTPLALSHQYNESATDFGGYFIVKGKERVLIFQERINYNHIYVFNDKKGGGAVSSSDYLAEIRSIKEDADYSVLIRVRYINEQFMVSVPYIQTPIPLGVLLIALKVDLVKFLDLFSSFPFHTRIKNALRIHKKWTFDECITHIGKYTMNRIIDSKRFNYTIQLIENEILPHLGLYANPNEHGDFLGLIVLKLCSTLFGNRPDDDRDHINNKRVETTGYLMGNLLRALFKKFIKATVQHMEKKTDLNILGAIQRFNLTQRLYHCFSTGNWGIQKSKYIRQGVSQILSRLSYAGAVCHLQRLAVPIGKESKNTQVRQVHASAFGFICVISSPEGASAGIVKTFASCVKISTAINSVIVRDIIHGMRECLSLDERQLGKEWVGFFINGVWIGSIRNEKIEMVVKKLKQMRLYHILDRQISIGFDMVDQELHLHCDEGRILRPVFDIHNEKYTDMKSCIEKGWDYCVEVGLIVYIDGYEVDFSHIALNIDGITDETSFLEIHPSLILGTVANLIPFPDHTQAPRNIYSVAQTKQAIGIYTQNFLTRFENAGHVLHYPQKRLVSTQYSKMCGFDENPAGINAVVAIACYTGFNMEDSIIINRSAIERGLFHSTCYKTVSTNETRRGTHGNERIEKVDEKLWNRAFNYSWLDDNGLVKKGSVVNVDDVLVGRVYYRNEIAERDTSLVCGKGENGVVDCIYETVNAQGYRHIKVRIRSLRIPEMGDKFSNLAAQKGTNSIQLSSEDMPFSEGGIVPDLLLNSNALPSRMTISMLLEMISGKAGAMTGKFADATAFCHGEELVDEVGKELVKNGFDATGDEWFTNGMTGERFKMKIFCGVSHYQRLKHLVGEKQHVRSVGNVQALTRQPTEGRSRNGGLRFGEICAKSQWWLKSLLVLL